MGKAVAKQSFWQVLDEMLNDIFDSDAEEGVADDSEMCAHIEKLSAQYPEWKRARKILELNFFGVEEAMKWFGVNPTTEDLAKLAKIPFSDEMLRKHKDTHILVAVFPLSIVEVRERAIQITEEGETPFTERCWYKNRVFACNRGEAGWSFVRKTPRPSGCKLRIAPTIVSEISLVQEDVEGVPSARVMVYTIIGHFLATRERLFTNIWVRCSDTNTSFMDFINVGNFEYGKLYLSSGENIMSHYGIEWAAIIPPDQVL